MSEQQAKQKKRVKYDTSPDTPDDSVPDMTAKASSASGNAFRGQRQWSTMSSESLITSGVNIQTFFRHPAARGVGCGNKPLSRSNWKWSKQEQKHTEASTGAGSCLLRVRLLLLQDQKYLAIDSVVGLALEIAIITLFGLTVDQLRQEDNVTFTEFDRTTNHFIGRVVLSFLLLLHYLVHLLIYKTTTLVSVYTFINAVTCVWQLVIAIICAVQKDLEPGRTYVPMFMRIWAARRMLLTLLAILRHGLPGGDLTFQFIRHTTQMLAVLGTCFGLFHVLEMLDGQFISFTEAFYFIMVTFSTVGYGEITPTFRRSKVLIMAIIFVSVGFVPVFLSKMQFIGDIYSKRRVYTFNKKHIIIAGYPSLKEATLLLNEMWKLSTRRRAIVFVSSQPFPPRIFALETMPKYAGKVFFIEGDIASKDVLDRAKADDADAIYLMCPRDAISSRGDYEVFRNSVGVNFLKPSLPQYLWTKHGAYNSLLKNVFVTVHRDLLKKTMIGIALNFPGVIPWFVNLMHTAESNVFSFVNARGKHEKTADVTSRPMEEKDMIEEWLELYHNSRQQITRLMAVPKALDGMLFEKAVLLLHNRFGVLPLAVGDKDTREVKINCGGRKLKSNQDLLVVLADGSGVVFQALDILNAEHEQRDILSTRNATMEEMEHSGVFDMSKRVSRRYFYPASELVETAAPQQPQQQRKAKGKKKEEEEGEVDEDLPDLNAAVSQAFVPAKARYLDTEPAVAGSPADTPATMPRLKPTSYAFIDESTTQFADVLSSLEEHAEMLAHRQENICLLAHLVRNSADPESIRRRSIKLLSRTEPQSESARFVTHINGSGLRGYYLDKAKVKDTRSILLFCTTEGRSEYGDAPLIAANQRIKTYLDEELMGVTDHSAVNDVREVIHPRKKGAAANNAAHDESIDVLPSHAKLAQSDTRKLEEYETRQMDRRRPCVLTELSSFRACHHAHPKHIDSTLFKHSESDFQTTVSFMAGCVLSTDMFQTLLIHAFHNALLHNFVQVLFYGRQAKQNTRTKKKKGGANKVVPSTASRKETKNEPIGEDQQHQPQQQQPQQRPFQQGDLMVEQTMAFATFGAGPQTLGDDQESPRHRTGSEGSGSGGDDSGSDSDDSIVLANSYNPHSDTDADTFIDQQMGGQHVARTDSQLINPNYVAPPLITQHVFKIAARKVYPVPHRFGSFHNRDNSFKTFGEALETLLMQYCVVCVGVWRLLPEGVSTIDGSRYMITNPPFLFELWRSDQIYFLR